MIRLTLNKQQARRLNTLAKSSDNIILILSNSSTTFLLDNIDFFKAVKFKEAVADTMQVYSVDTKLIIATCIDEGFLEINIDNAEVQFTYKNKNNKCISTAAGAISSIPTSRIADIYNYINPSGYAPLRILALEHAGALIDLCAATNNSLVISSDMVLTTSNSIKAFIKTREDKSIKNPIGLTVEAIKEIEKYVSDCSVYNIANYLILYKPGFVLGVRKANIKFVEEIPPQFTHNEGALLTAKLDFGYLSYFLANISPKLLRLDSSCRCIFNLKNGFIKVSQTGEIYKLPLGVAILKASDKLSTFSVSLQDLVNTKNIIVANKEVDIAVYNNILRFTSAGVNIIMRWSVANGSNK